MKAGNECKWSKKGTDQKMNLETLTEPEKKTIEPTSSLGGFTGFYIMLYYYILLYYYVTIYYTMLFTILLYSFFMNSSYSFFKRLF